MTLITRIAFALLAASTLSSTAVAGHHETGEQAAHPKAALHYDGSCGEPVTVEIRGQGPVSTDFIQFN